MTEDLRYGEEGYKEMKDGGLMPYYDQSMHESFPKPDTASQVNRSAKGDSERKDQSRFK